MAGKMKIKLLTLSYLIFVLALFLSGALGDGIASDIVYYLSFILPVVICELALKKSGESTPERMRVSGDGLLVSLSLAVPLILITGLISLGTSSLIYALFGASQSVALEGDIISNILKHALLPAFLEEILFRYLPMRMMRGYRGWMTVIVSSLAFSVAHVSVYSALYAFVAGCLLMCVTLSSGSVIPAFVLHFINNLCSVLLMTYGWVEAFKTSYYVIICLLFVASIAVIFVFRSRFVRCIHRALTEGDNAEFPKETLLYILPVMALAIMNFVGGLQ